jgi:hypothetical protein
LENLSGLTQCLDVHISNIKICQSDKAAFKSLYTGDLMQRTSVDSAVSGYYLGDKTKGNPEVKIHMPSVPGETSRDIQEVSVICKQPTKYTSVFMMYFIQ